MRRITNWILPAAGLVLIVTGLLVGVTTPRTVSVGWFAYSPLSETTFAPADSLVLTRGVAVAWALGVLGALLLAFWAGWFLALRRARREGSPIEP